MLATSNAVSSASCKASSDLVESELEEGDDWVIVKKQKITIWVPPPSPSNPESTNPEKYTSNQLSIVQRTSGDRNKRQHELTKDKHKEPNYDPLTVGTAVNSRVQEPLNDLATVREKLKASGHGKQISKHKRDYKAMNLPRPLPIGALNVVNRRMRVVNLERELEGVGGLRRWLVAKGLHQFITVLERENVGKYELVNLTMGRLKEMGTDAVGPRRKLVHAIESLCHPYYFKPRQ